MPATIWAAFNSQFLACIVAANIKLCTFWHVSGRLVLALFATCLIVTAAVGEEWSQFRGPNLDGVATDVQLPTEWSADKNVRWKVTIAGVGWSQPVVWGERIFITTAESDVQSKPDPTNTGPGVSGFAMLFSGAGYNPEPPTEVHRWKVLCLDAATGRLLWERVAREGPPTMHIHANNTYASETPATDGQRLIAYFGMTGVYCYDLAGNPLWQKDLGAYPTQFGWGTGSSPVLFGDRVYLQCDNEKSSFIVALDKKTGDQEWRADREEKSNWSTPFVWRNKLRTELVTAGGAEMRSYDPESGELLWSMKGSGRTATTPVGDEELLYVDSYDRLTGGNGVLAAIRPGGSGDISLSGNATSNDYVAWSARIRAYRIASPLLSQGCLYFLENNLGIVRCLDAKTGAEHYRKRLPGARGCVSSPLTSGDHVYCLDTNGRMTVLDAAAGPELKVVASNELDEMCWATPAIASNNLLVRTVDHLYCVGAD
ncbi:MAG TPA: PQQ-binding-like beta-propeller repeat protein [Lacipirellulaceae bacterium]|nr:PQQ-binding-like beta-propeller repeat protein [Lacipirellulaceae bacterium]